MGATEERPRAPAVVAVCGPTGSGKSTLALNLAESFEGEIVNCDSLQLYRGLDIGTAKTPAAERRGIPHHLFDVLDVREGYSAGEYARHARAIIAQITARDRLPIVVGGTGFYLQALLHGLPELPTGDRAMRARLLQKEQGRAGALHRLLTRLEPVAAARVHPHDIQKITRALEVRLLTGRALPSVTEAQPLKGYLRIKIGLNPDRAALNERLDARVVRMFNDGLIEEIERLLKQGATGAEKPFESLGYKQALLHLRGELSLNDAIASTQLETRQYAKRQLTWFRRDPEITWLEGFGEEPRIVEAARVCLADKLGR
jgi:tRNA dimethylallyltransferase